MAAQRKRAIAREEPASLRRGGSAPIFTDEQLLMVCVFVVSALQGGMGTYLKLNEQGNSLRMKFYGDDDSYQDTLTNQDDIQYLLDDYAKQLKVQAIFQGLMGSFHAATSQQAPGAAGDGQDIPQGRSTPRKPS